MTPRQIGYTALGLFLAAGIAIAYWPLVRADRAMNRFCEQLPVGATLATVRQQAAAQGYTVSVNADGGVVVDDPIAEGRRQCTLQFGRPAAASAASR